MTALEIASRVNMILAESLGGDFLVQIKKVEDTTDYRKYVNIELHLTELEKAKKEAPDHG